MKKAKAKDIKISCCSGGSFWGWLLIILGIWFLAKELGYISTSFSIWPALLVLLGIYIISKKKTC